MKRKSILSRVKSRIERLFSFRSHPSNPSLKTLGVWGYRETAAGVSVNESTALECIAVLACIKILSETTAMLPLKVYRQLAPRGREPDPQHPLYRVLHDEVNPQMSAMTLRQTLVAHRASWGNAYASKEYNGAGDLIAMWPLRPDRTWPERLASGRVVYRTTLPSGEQRILDADDVFHLKGLSYDGLKGYSPIAQAREAIGLAMAAQEYGARFFSNGAAPDFALKHPGVLGQKGRENLRESFEERHMGLGKSHRLAILEEGMQIEKIGIPPEDAQFLETRQFQVRDIARLYRIPLHMLADMEKGSGYSSVEHMSLAFVVYTLMPWLVDFEQEAQRSLLLPSERTTWFCRHVVSGLLRGDIKSRYEAYAIGRQWGWLSADDVRELEDLNPLPDGQGNQYLVPLNMVPADQVEVLLEQQRILKRLDAPPELIVPSNGNGRKVRQP